MSPRVPAVVAVLLVAAAPAFAQDWYEPNPSLAELSADDAYARESARSLRTAGIGAGADAIRLDDAGRVLVAGSWDWTLVVRIDADGRLDPTFGAAGVADIPASAGGALGLAVDAAGRIVVTGFLGEMGTFPWSPGYDGPVYGAARLLADGSLDLSFSGDGLLELDAASGLEFLGPVHASGDDGAMIALAEKPSPAQSYFPLVGLVRITADGTIDATYGGGFAQIAKYSPFPPFSPYSVDVNVADFAVDSLGGAVVAVRDDYGYSTAQRRDAGGGFDPSFGNPGCQSYCGADFAASEVALDGAGRIVGLDDFTLWRRFSDGAPDPTFSGNGFAPRIEAAAFPGSAWGYAELLANERMDPDFTGNTKFLAAATRADRWALAKLVEYRNTKGRVVAHGIEVQAIDPADPGAIVSTAYRSPDRSFSQVKGLVIAPEGTAAYALGDTFVLRVDLTSPKPLPLPDLRARWVGIARAIDLGGGRYRVTASVRIRNASRRDAAAAFGHVGFAPGVFDIPLDGAPNDIGYSQTFRVRARSSVVRRFTWEGGNTSTNLAGVRLGIQVSCELPDANFADNTATSQPITPVYAPR